MKITAEVIRTSSPFGTDSTEVEVIVRNGDDITTYRDRMPDDMFNSMYDRVWDRIKYHLDEALRGKK